MKKSTITLIFTIAYLASYAQIGIKAGLNLANYTYAESSPDVHRKSLMAYNFGIQYKKELSEKLYLLPELGYTHKGSRVYYDYPIGYTGPMKNINKFQYIQLTLPTIIALPINDEYDYEIGGGLFAAYLTKATQKTVEFDDSYETRNFTPDATKKMDVGLHFTTGFRMGKILGLHASYDLGLTNIQGHSTDPIAKTRNFSINLSWIFADND